MPASTVYNARIHSVVQIKSTRNVFLICYKPDKYGTIAIVCKSTLI